MWLQWNNKTWLVSLFDCFSNMENNAMISLCCCSWSVGVVDKTQYNYSVDMEHRIDRIDAICSIVAFLLIKNCQNCQFATSHPRRQGSRRSALASEPFGGPRWSTSISPRHSKIKDKFGTGYERDRYLDGLIILGRAIEETRSQERVCPTPHEPPHKLWLLFCVAVSNLKFLKRVQLHSMIHHPSSASYSEWWINWQRSPTYPTMTQSSFRRYCQALGIRHHCWWWQWTWWIKCWRSGSSTSWDMGKPAACRRAFQCQCHLKLGKGGQEVWVGQLSQNWTSFSCSYFASPWIHQECSSPPYNLLMVRGTSGGAWNLSLPRNGLLFDSTNSTCNLLMNMFLNKYFSLLDLWLLIVLHKPYVVGTVELIEGKGKGYSCWCTCKEIQWPWKDTRAYVQDDVAN